MSEVMIYLAAWVALGVPSFFVTVYWWRGHSDVTVGLALFFGVVCAVTGPSGGISVLIHLAIDAIGGAMDRAEKHDRVLWRRRQ